jgi:hypothetical protein
MQQLHCYSENTAQVFCTKLYSFTWEFIPQYNANFPKRILYVQTNYHTYIYISIQRDATMRSIYSLFHCKFTHLVYMFRVPFTTIIRSTGNCSRRPLVQVICHNMWAGVVTNPLGSIHSQEQTHYTMVKFSHRPLLQVMS